MAKDNIYDLIISELILRTLGGSGPSGITNLVITSTLLSNNVPANFNSLVAFTSTITNIPSGYSIGATTHIITYPTAEPPTVGSVSIISGNATAVILGLAGSTFIVTSTVDLIHPTDPTITLNSTYTVTATTSIYYGIKAFSVTPDITGLATMSSASNQFQMTTSILGRMYIVTPLITPLIVSVVDQNGLLYTMLDFTISVVGGLRYYILNYDTQLTGSNIKTFTLNF